MSKTKTVKIKAPKKPKISAAEATEQTGKIELKAIETIKHWVYNSPEKAIMINPDLDIFITDPNSYSVGSNSNSKIEQVRFNEAGQIAVRTEDNTTETLIHHGDFSTNDIFAILQAIEETIKVKD